MSKRKKVNISVIILVVLFILYSGARLRMNKDAELNSVQFEVPPYAEPGPYQVGIRNLNIESEKPLEITVWYPASAIMPPNSGVHLFL